MDKTQFSEYARALVACRWKKQSPSQREAWGRKMGLASGYFRNKYGWGYWNNKKLMHLVELEKIENHKASLECKNEIVERGILKEVAFGDGKSGLKELQENVGEILAVDKPLDKI